MAFIAGYLGKLAVSVDGGTSYLNVAGVMNVSAPVSAGVYDVTSKDDAQYKRFIGGRVEGKLSADGFYDNADPGQATIRAAVKSRAMIKLRYRPDTGNGKEQYTSDAFAISIEDSSPNDGANTIKFEFQLSGEPQAVSTQTTQTT